MSARAPSTELRVARLLTIAGGVVTLVIIVSRRAVVPDPRALPWSYTAPVLAGLLLAVLAAARAPWAGREEVRLLNRLAVVGHLAPLLAVAAGSAAGALPRDVTRLPWTLSTIALPVTGAALGWGTTGSCAVLAVAVGTVRLGRLGTGQHDLTSTANDVQAAATSVVLIVLVAALLAAARDHDRAVAHAFTAAERTATERAVRAAHRRTQALVHDEVLATLFLAAHGAPALRDQIAAKAARCRRLIREMTATPGSVPVPLSDLVERLRHSAEEVGAELLIPAGLPRLGLPAEAATALAGAARQALINSRDHAGDGARRRLALRAGTDGVRIVVSDDGVGFDPHRVGPDRMGVSVSILGRMSSIEGGDADVSSGSGGTRVVLAWSRPEAESVAAMRPAGHLGTGLPVILATVALTQMVLCVLAGDWVSYIGLAAILVGLVVMGWRRLEPPTPARTAVVLLVSVGASVLPLLRTPHGYGEAWYLTGAAFVLAGLAARGRPLTALAGTVLATAVGGACVVLRPHPEAAATLVRPATTAAIASLYTLAIQRMQRSTTAVRGRELASLRERAWARTRDEELRRRSRFLDDVIGRTLDLLAAGAELDADLRGDCVALEGRLRDLYRGGRLARQPLVDAAMAARRRGVDVVFLDDAPGHHLAEDTLDAIAHWMRGHMDRVVSGRFTGRILPPGRDALASAVTSEESTLFRG